MNINTITFNETVRGFNHIQNETICEDSSASLSTDKYKIIVVADGHGGKEYFRSAKGSNLITDITVESLKSFVENLYSSDQYLNEFLNNPRFQKLLIKELTDSIIADWHDHVTEDLNDNAFDEEESLILNSHPDFNNNLSRIYGTTLLAALMTEDFTLILQQGDGKCEVFYDNEIIDQPIEMDERCFGNVTTSICDTDAYLRIRSKVIDHTKDKENISAIFLCTDGVDDSYFDSEKGHLGLDNFYKNFLVELTEKGTTDFFNYLPQKLSDFSEKGELIENSSGDDLSIAGIINLEDFESSIEKFKNDIDHFKVSSSLDYYTTRRNGKLRKYNYLKDQISHNQEIINSEKRKFENLEKEKTKFLKKREKLEIKLNHIERELKEGKEFMESKLSDKEKIDNLDKRLLDQSSISYLEKLINNMYILDKVSGLNEKNSRRSQKLKHEISYLDSGIVSLDIEQKAANEAIKNAENNYKQSINDFTQFEVEFNELEDIINQLNERLSELSQN